MNLVEVGFVPDADLRALYTGAEAFCFPSLSEGFGLPPLEAMGCGTPVLSAPYGPAKEVLGNAAQILALDPEGWAVTISRLMSDREHRARWVALGSAHAKSFRWAKAVEQVAIACHAASGNGRA